MYDRFIERLAVSDYRDNFILKGGFYLSTLFGLESRTTKDIDVSIKEASFNRENIEHMIKSIISIDIKDGAIFEFSSIEMVRDEDEYGGYRIVLSVRIDNMRENFQIDIATGDPITPSPDDYKYYPLMSDKAINVWSYNLETIIAEKLETILKRAEANGRTRDYYDLYLIYTKGWDSINLDNLKSAINKTLSKREYTGNILEVISLLKNSDIMKNRLILYSRKYDYARGISYEEVMNCISEIVKFIVPGTV